MQYVAEAYKIKHFVIQWLLICHLDDDDNDDSEYSVVSF